MDFGLLVCQVVVWFPFASFILFGFLYTVFLFGVTRPIQNQPHIVFIQVRGSTYKAFSGHHTKAMAKFTAGFLKWSGHEVLVGQNLLQLGV